MGEANEVAETTTQRPCSYMGLCGLRLTRVASIADADSFGNPDHNTHVRGAGFFPATQERGHYRTRPYSRLVVQLLLFSRSYHLCGAFQKEASLAALNDK